EAHKDRTKKTRPLTRGRVGTFRCRVEELSGSSPTKSQGLEQLEDSQDDQADDACPKRHRADRAVYWIAHPMAVTDSVFCEG
ncbi:MAG: hypothetical protein ACI84D_003723, partial [Thalassolituus oleivorans]